MEDHTPRSTRSTSEKKAVVIPPPPPEKDVILGLLSDPDIQKVMAVHSDIGRLDHHGQEETFWGF